MNVKTLGQGSSKKDEKMLHDIHMALKIPSRHVILIQCCLGAEGQ